MALELFVSEKVESEITEMRCTSLRAKKQMARERASSGEHTPHMESLRTVLKEDDDPSATHQDALIRERLHADPQNLEDGGRRKEVW